MRIGVDFDNTIAKYDRLFAALAVERGLMATPPAGGKTAVRDAVRALPAGRERLRRTDPASIKRRTASCGQPAFANPPERAKAMSWREPLCQPSPMIPATASFLTAAISPSLDTSAGSSKSENSTGSPVSWTDGGKTVQPPFARYSIRVPRPAHSILTVEPADSTL